MLKVGREEGAIATPCFIFICNSFESASILPREPLIRFNFPAMSAYVIAHTCVWPEFSRGGTALLGTVGEDIVAGGRKSGIPDTSLAYIFDLLSRQIHSRLHIAVFTRLNETPRNEAIQDRDFETRKWAPTRACRRRWDTSKIKPRE